jgi:CPA2 family monovalent cation:H+ antiporter-2
MDPRALPLLTVLLLLACSVLAVVVCRALRLPPMVGYLVTGIALGPHALGVVSDRAETHVLAEFGVVFLMFSIGLEFSLPKLTTIAAALAITAALGTPWQAGLALGGIVAMSSTAIVSKLLAERGELDSPQGREVIAVLLFQDLAFVPLVVLIPVLGQPADAIGMAVALALAKAAAALGIVILGGPRPMRMWLRARTSCSC